MKSTFLYNWLCLCKFSSSPLFIPICTVICTQKTYQQKTHFAGIGDDEFVLVFKDTDNTAETQAFFDVVKYDLEHVYVDDCLKEIPITFSVGKAIYPSQYRDIDDLLHFADRDMYQNKFN